MPEIDATLLQILILLFLSIVLIYFGLKLNMPPIVGFLVTGVLMGQVAGEGFDQHSPQLEFLSELGVVLLLFTIGLEFSVQKLLQIKKLVLLGGSLQMLAGIVIITPIAKIWFSWNLSLAWAIFFTLSSTAIVLKIFQDRGEMDSAHGRGAFAILIFQDLAVVPLMVIMPLLAGAQLQEPVWRMFLNVVGVFALVFVASIWVVPFLMRLIATTKSNELFLFTVILLCLGTAFLTNRAGLSMALGAFLAGMVLASSPYAYQAIGSVMPMRDIFTSLFFVSIGLKMDIGLLFRAPLLTIGLAVAVMLVNTAATTLGMKILGLTTRVSLLVGFSLCQVGEFAFVLAKQAEENSFFSGDDLPMFLNVAVLSMAMTPLALALGRKLSGKVSGLGLDKDEAQGPPLEYRDHAIVVGFGVAGQSVARACRLTGRQYAVIDMNPLSVASFQKLGEPIIFGDAVNEHVLEHVGVHHASMLIVSIPDTLATRRIIVLAKTLNPKIHVVARTRFLLTKEILGRLGADSVVTEEFEAAIEVFDRVLTYFKLPEEEKHRRIHEARAAGPIDFRDPDPKG
ncbi:MAG: cation:proton antiporter [Deltaproteobacteria bacterium]|jgi:CPA2 family monovalent cation:H+ antiporter-2|nr:cation:proton antiporter [Deltaproteobacteria bacterium]